MTWRVAVGPSSVYALEAVHRLAFDAGIDVCFVTPSPLEGPDSIFFQDYVRYRLPISLGERLARFGEEWTAAGGEALSAAAGVAVPAGAPAHAGQPGLRW